jgi:hypothetical protein
VIEHLRTFTLYPGENLELGVVNYAVPDGIMRATDWREMMDQVLDDQG